jgi:transmembrane sensor
LLSRATVRAYEAIDPVTDIREPSARTLALFLSGECSDAQADEVLRWAASSRDAAARLEALRAAWEATRRPIVGGVGSWNTDQIWDSVKTRLHEEPQAPLRLVTPERPPKRSTSVVAQGRDVSIWVTAAACVTLLVGVAANERAARRAASQPPPVTESVREFRTQRGQRASGTLPDGSAFQLGPMSLLRVPSSYGGTSRDVSLEGDAYFNVTHDARRPFSVHTARTTVRDLGTRFIVRARPTERRVEVAVSEGEVAVEPNDGAAPRSGVDSRKPQRLMVSAGQVALVDERGLARLLPRASVTSRFAWTRGELAFDQALVPEVLAELSRWYGDTFVLADSSLARVRLTTVLRGETLLEALVLLETALDVEARVHRDTVTLTRHKKNE